MEEFAMAEPVKPATTVTAKPASASKPLAYSPGVKAEQQIGDPRGDTFLTPDEIKSLAGDLLPGEIGWVKLDDQGTPTGAATKEIPPVDGEPVARVIGSPTHKYDEIVTPSGAPVTKFMNPDPVLWDAGMLARNPVNEAEQKKADEVTGGKRVTGAPVINKPGTV